MTGAVGLISAMNFSSCFQLSFMGTYSFMSFKIRSSVRYVEKICSSLRKRLFLMYDLDQILSGKETRRSILSLRIERRVGTGMNSENCSSADYI